MSNELKPEDVKKMQKAAYLKGAATQLAASGVSVEKAKPMVRKLEKLANDRETKAEKIRGMIREARA